MKALIGTAAVVVIAACGYFVYDNLQTKAAAAAEEARVERACRGVLYKDKRHLMKLGKWHGTTLEEKVKAFADIPEYNNFAGSGKDLSGLSSNIFASYWEHCGPIE
jgi:hypothetical protein